VVHVCGGEHGEASIRGLRNEPTGLAAWPAQPPSRVSPVPGTSRRASARLAPLSPRRLARRPPLTPVRCLRGAVNVGRISSQTRACRPAVEDRAPGQRRDCPPSWSEGVGGTIVTRFGTDDGRGPVWSATCFYGAPAVPRSWPTLARRQPRGLGWELGPGAAPHGEKFFDAGPRVRLAVALGSWLPVRAYTLQAGSPAGLARCGRPPLRVGKADPKPQRLRS